MFDKSRRRIGRRRGILILPPVINSTRWGDIMLADDAIIVKTPTGWHNSYAKDEYCPICYAKYTAHSGSEMAIKMPPCRRCLNASFQTLNNRYTGNKKKRLSLWDNLFEKYQR